MHTQVSNPVGLLTLARETRLPASWLKAEARRGRLPCLRVGKQYLFNIDAVRRALAERAKGRRVANGAS